MTISVAFDDELSSETGTPVVMSRPAAIDFLASQGRDRWVVEHMNERTLQLAVRFKLNDLRFGLGLGAIVLGESIKLDAASELTGAAS